MMLNMVYIWYNAVTWYQSTSCEKFQSLVCDTFYTVVAKFLVLL